MAFDLLGGQRLAMAHKQTEEINYSTSGKIPLLVSLVSIDGSD